MEGVFPLLAELRGLCGWFEVAATCGISDLRGRACVGRGLVRVWGRAGDFRGDGLLLPNSRNLFGWWFWYDVVISGEVRVYYYRIRVICLVDGLVCRRDFRVEGACSYV